MLHCVYLLSIWEFLIVHLLLFIYTVLFENFHVNFNLFLIDNNSNDKRYCDIRTCELISALYLNLNYYFVKLHDDWFIILSVIDRLGTYIFVYLGSFFW